MMIENTRFSTCNLCLENVRIRMCRVYLRCCVYVCAYNVWWELEFAMSLFTISRCICSETGRNGECHKFWFHLISFWWISWMHATYPGGSHDNTYRSNSKTQHRNEFIWYNALKIDSGLLKCCQFHCTFDAMRKVLCFFTISSEIVLVHGNFGRRAYKMRLMWRLLHKNQKNINTRIIALFRLCWSTFNTD